MINQQYVEQYYAKTGRNLQEDVKTCLTEYFNLSKYLTKYGIVEEKTMLRLWHNGVTVDDIVNIENSSSTEWDVLAYLNTKLFADRVKEMPLVSAGIIPADDED